MASITIRVQFVGRDWAVSSKERLEPLLFLSGAMAEAEACRWALAFARSGVDAAVEVWDQAGELAGVLSYRSQDHAVVVAVDFLALRQAASRRRAGARAELGEARQSRPALASRLGEVRQAPTVTLSST